ncbi:MAG: 50S ribosomal protein L29 [Chloroflexi bacterium]|nr:50S ribosomal protein L29 [Chloroflexota bacterium]MBU1750911.1 50S ribosomal protein L29 [Chloroflexota bacterium]
MKSWESLKLADEWRQRAARSDHEFDSVIAEIDQQIQDNKQELFNLRFQLATRQLKNYKRLRLVRRQVARWETLRRELEIQAWERAYGELE